jgi:hypothetical protein
MDGGRQSGVRALLRPDMYAHAGAVEPLEQCPAGFAPGVQVMLPCSWAPTVSAPRTVYAVSPSHTCPRGVAGYDNAVPHHSAPRRPSAPQTSDMGFPCPPGTYSLDTEHCWRVAVAATGVTTASAGGSPAACAAGGAAPALAAARAARCCTAGPGYACWHGRQG